MKFSTFGIVAISSILALLAGCGGGEEAPEQAPVARPVKVMTVGGSAGGEVSFPGRVAAGEQVDLAFRVGGPLIELPVHEGEKVNKGQVVARIDPRDFRIRVNSAQARFDKAEADIERLSALYEKDAASKTSRPHRPIHGLETTPDRDGRCQTDSSSSMDPFANTPSPWPSYGGRRPRSARCLR